MSRALALNQDARLYLH